MTTIRRLTPEDMADAVTVVAEAFGTQAPVLPGPAVGHPIPFRWPLDATAATSPDGAFVAEGDDGIIGVGIVRMLGRVGVIGPIAVAPRAQRRGLGERLTRACLGCAREQDCTTVGLATFPNSVHHFSLYTRVGLLPAGLAVFMCRDVPAEDVAGVLTGRMLVGSQVRRWSQLDGPARDRACQAIAVICASYLPGYDPSVECEIAAERAIGETLLLYRDDELLGFALCSGGPAAPMPGAGLWIRTLALRPGDQAIAGAERLVEAAQGLARDWDEPRIGLPVNPDSLPVLDWLQAEGYRAEDINSLMMHGSGLLPTNGICWHDWR